MKFEKTEVWGFEHAIRGMRNPLESWKNMESVLHGEYEELKDENTKDNTRQDLL